jgi:hypothetical protein
MRTSFPFFPRQLPLGAISSLLLPPFLSTYSYRPPLPMSRPSPPFPLPVAVETQHNCPSAARSSGSRMPDSSDTCNPSVPLTVLGTLSALAFLRRLSGLEMPLVSSPQPFFWVLPLALISGLKPIVMT